MYSGAAGIALQLLAQAADVDVHCPDIAAGIVAPDRAEQRIARIDAVRIAHQKLDHVEFLRRQLDEPAVIVGVARVAVE